jgi:hypothetical protein
MHKSRRAAGVLTAILVAGLTSCVETSWEAARKLDTVGAYNQFIRDNPSSSRLTDARERMAYVRVKTYQTIEVYEEFRRQHPKSDLTAELHALVEPLYFERARARNSTEAYDEFLASYPNATLSKRARGNRAYVTDVLADPTNARLAQFVDMYPESDFVAEAKSTLALGELSKRTQFRRLGVRVDVAPNVVQQERVVRGFASLVAKAYAERGIGVTLLRVNQALAADLDGYVRVDYKEAPGQATIGGASVYSYCRIRLFHRESEEPIWDRSFEAPAEHLLKGAYGRDKTVFGSSKYPFWKDFFVPVSTWAVSDARVNTLSYLEDVRSIHLRGDAAALLLDRGGIDFLDISSVTGLRVAERYRREVDLADWRGVRLLRYDLAVSFGNDGAELIRRADQQATRLARWDAGEIGAVRSAALYDDATLLLAGNRGLHAIRLGRAPLLPQPLLDGDIVGIEVDRGLVFVIRPRTIEVAHPEHLLAHITAVRVAFPEGFRAERARRIDDRILVFGPDAVAEVSIASPARPEITAVVDQRDVGNVADMTADGRYRYILGERGLQIADPESARVEDYIQVTADRSVALKGRFALLVGRATLEVLDLAPYQSGPIYEANQAARTTRRATAGARKPARSDVPADASTDANEGVFRPASDVEDTDEASERTAATPESDGAEPADDPTQSSAADGETDEASDAEPGDTADTEAEDGEATPDAEAEPD